MYWDVRAQQFLDPCYAIKFHIDGTYIEGPAYKNLDRYFVEVIGDKIYVDFGNIQKGEQIHPYYYSIIWTKQFVADAGHDSLEKYLEQAGYLPYTKDK